MHSADGPQSLLCSGGSWVETWRCGRSGPESSATAGAGQQHNSSNNTTTTLPPARHCTGRISRGYTMSCVGKIWSLFNLPLAVVVCRPSQRWRQCFWTPCRSGVGVVAEQQLGSHVRSLCWAPHPTLSRAPYKTRDWSVLGSSLCLCSAVMLPCVPLLGGCCLLSPVCCNPEHQPRPGPPPGTAPPAQRPACWRIRNTQGRPIEDVEVVWLLLAVGNTTTAAPTTFIDGYNGCGPRNDKVFLHPYQ